MHYHRPEFGPSNQGKVAVIIHALYGFKSSGAVWHSHFAATLQDLDFCSSLADPDVWMHTAAKPNGFEYYEYLLVNVDDLLMISYCAQDIVTKLKTQYGYVLKDVGSPK